VNGGHSGRRGIDSLVADRKASDRLIRIRRIAEPHWPCDRRTTLCKLTVTQTQRRVFHLKSLQSQRQWQLLEYAPARSAWTVLWLTSRCHPTQSAVTQFMMLSGAWRAVTLYDDVMATTRARLWLFRAAVVTADFYSAWWHNTSVPLHEIYLFAHSPTHGAHVLFTLGLCWQFETHLPHSLHGVSIARCADVL